MAENNTTEKQLLVSIVVPVFNSERYLSNCIESICKQTYKNIEIIIVNDGSTDKSLEIIQEYAKKDSRIIIINQKNSGGIVSRRNGINKSSGDYVLLEDSDDWLEEDLVEKCVKTIKKYDAIDIVKFGFVCEPSKLPRNVLNDGLVNKNILVGKDINQIIRLLLYNTCCNQVWNQMVKKELFDFGDDIFDCVVHKGEDLQINLQLYQKARKVFLLKENLYHYYDNPNGITNDIDTTKVINNVKDIIYLNNIKKKIALRLFGYVDENNLVNRLLSILSGKILRILANNKNPKTDLIEIEKALGSGLSSYLSAFNSKNLNQNFIKKKVCINIINGDYLGNLRYLAICRVLRLVGMIK